MYIQFCSRFEISYIVVDFDMVPGMLQVFFLKSLKYAGFLPLAKWNGNHILIMYYTKSVGPTARLVDEIQKKPITSPIHKIRFCSVFVSIIMVENRPCKRTLNFLFSGRLANGRGINQRKKRLHIICRLILPLSPRLDFQ